MSDDGARVVKRSVTLAGHRTSVALEQAFWTEIDALTERRGISFAQLLTEADRARAPAQSLASTMRLLALREAKPRA